ncbi:MAG TPA: fructose-bisphosphatase class II [Mycetocola sp.]|uniref:fructose-bisphosphatase class II family protein n=1 Tax=Mycetocola sp. TaxID=1871042 RepID=UPI002604BFDD|nr:fructose-bisphosphatase class II [Mycetocola sp.]MCU1559892.1 Fructose,6-bisphosphatase [Mycetocola sp.]HEV7849595.1 fructose-bisphosphatase class II [Mycetocola sp.]
MTVPSLPADVLEGFARATRIAAIATVDLLGSGNKHDVDRVAVVALRDALAGIEVDGLVLVGEGEKDEAPMLHIGERFGTGNGPAVDIAVDPVDGTRLAAENSPGSVAVLAVAARGTLYDIGPAHYMEKLVTDASGASLRLAAPLAENLERLADARGAAVSDLVVAVQDRPRNATFVAAARAAGARVDLFADGDVERCLLAAQRGTAVDLLVGIGGAPEGILTAAAVRALGGHMETRLAPQRRNEAQRVRLAGFDTDRVLTLADLCSGDAWLFLTAITDCRIEPDRVLPGVRVDASHVVTSSWSAGPGIMVRRTTARTAR